MKKYNLVIKESVEYIEIGDFPTLTEGNKGVRRYKMLSKKGVSKIGKPFSFMLNIEDNRNEEMTTFTQQEIDELPYGFVKLFDIIEVKEELYYIKLPYTSEYYLNQDKRDGGISYANNISFGGYQTKFTLDYIKDTFPLFVEFAVKVEEEE